MGRFLAESLGADQPLYAIHANGVDGRETMTGGVMDMARAYVEEILGAQPKPNGPFLIAGMCHGELAAIEVARELQARGREVGQLILFDPPAVPPLGSIKRNQTIDTRNPLVAAQLYQRVRGVLLRRDSHYLPFAANDQQQLHFATLAGVNSLVALSTHVPEIFSGAVTAIVSFERAAAFFHPQLRWAKLLSRRPAVHVLPYSHLELFGSANHEFSRVLNFVLEGAMNSETRVERTAEAAFASA